MSRLIIRRLLYILGLALIVFNSNASVIALSTNDVNSIYNDTVWYDLGAGNSACGTDTGGTISGSDPESITWNYFKSLGLGDVQVAGIMGNMQQESHFSPTIMQIGGNSNNPYDAKDLGWGIIQWSGNGNTGHSTGDKVTQLYNEANLTDPVYEISTELNLVWHHLNNNPPITKGFDLNQFNQLTTPQATALYFLNQVEAGTDPNGVRESNAVAILKKYGGTVGTGGGCGGSVDCSSASGVAKIICAAKAYDSVSYSETADAGHQGGAAWHASCPTIGPSCILDCSGLVNIAVYDVFQADLKENTYSEAGDSQYWQHISFSQAQPGDLIQPGIYNGGHVEIIDHIQGQTIYTFGAHSSSLPQGKQVGPSSYQADPSDVYLHYIGPGSS